jgi:hypothetical protein
MRVGPARGQGSTPLAYFQWSLISRTKEERDDFDSSFKK